MPTWLGVEQERQTVGYLAELSDTGIKEEILLGRQGYGGILIILRGTGILQVNLGRGELS